MPGNIGLACTERLLEFGHAKFARHERAKQTQTCRVGQNLENFGCLGGGTIERPSITVRYGGEAFHDRPVATGRSHFNIAMSAEGSIHDRVAHELALQCGRKRRLKWTGDHRAGAGCSRIGFGDWLAES